MNDGVCVGCWFGIHQVVVVKWPHGEERKPAESVCMSLSLSLDEVAALVSMSVSDSEEVVPGVLPVEEICVWVAELICAGGTRLACQALSDIKQLLDSGAWNATYWRNCQRLAHAVIAFADQPLKRAG